MSGRGFGRWRVPLRRHRSRSEEAAADLGAGPLFDNRERAPADARIAAALRVVDRAVLMAEEKYPAEPGASVGTWFARVQETISVACRVAVRRLDEDHRPCAADLAGEQLGLLADICAEATRAAAQTRPGGSALGSRVEALLFLAGHDAPALAECHPDVLVLLVHCTAALEPLANGLRQGDLQVADAVDQAIVGECFLAAFGRAFAGVYALC